METNSYQRIKNVIFSNLKNISGILAAGQIKQEIASTQNLINSVGLETYRQFLADKSELHPLTDEDWGRMERELETHFNVEMQAGVVIQGDEQKDRDITWWTGEEKDAGQNYYWNRYKNYIKEFLPAEVAAVIDKDTDVVMNNIGNPKDPRLNAFERKGMVVGHVQSGKTGNYTALVCKAADAGYKFIVVIAGGTNNLRNQTQKRLNEGFVGRDKGTQVGAGIGNSPQELLPICLTTADRDFNKQDADRNSQGLNFDNIKVPVLIVIKKELNALKNVIDWLTRQYKNKIAEHSMLIIDDESDYASINTKGLEDPTVINKRIRELISFFSKGTYVAYTATPYANIFIDHQAAHGEYGDDLFPKDFIYALDAPTNYFGARKIFLDTFDRHIIEIPEEDLSVLPLKQKIDEPPAYIPESLKRAIRLFIVNVSIRKLRGQENQHNSMLVHISRFTSFHKKTAIYIDDYLEDIKKDVNVYGKLPDADFHSSHIKQIKETCEAVHSARPPEETMERILDGICTTIESIKVKQVHKDEKIPLEYRRGSPTNAIAVGGASLARGFTLEGLSVSYFIRSTIFYDTLMQMGRWFGYRPGYEDLCRIFLPEDTIEYFQGIIEATEDLFLRFKDMADNNLTPAEFGLYVQQHPESVLQVTARNKQKNSRDFFFDMNLDGHLKETAYLSPDDKDRNTNFEAVKTLVNKLGQRAFETPNKGKKQSADEGTSYLWRDVEKDIIKEFLENFRTHIKGAKDPLGIFTRMPIDFIKKYADEQNKRWDVALYSGSGSKYSEFENKNIVIKKEKRKLDWKEKKGCFEVRNRQVSSGNAEEISLNETQKAEAKGKRGGAREKLPRPLLMLHILEMDNDTENKNKRDFAAFGVSFPKYDGISSSKTVRLKINTVYYQEILKQLEEETNDE